MKFFRNFFASIRRQWVDERAWEEFTIALVVGVIAGLIVWYVV